MEVRNIYRSSVFVTGQKIRPGEDAVVSDADGKGLIDKGFCEEINKPKPKPVGEVKPSPKPKVKPKAKVKAES
jgi:hypothetical protein